MTNPEEIDVRRRVTLLSRGLAAAAALLVVLVTAPPSFAAPTLTVSATTGLTDGQTITISGSGFDPNLSSIAIGQCIDGLHRPRPTATPAGGATFRTPTPAATVAAFTIVVKEKFGEHRLHQGAVRDRRRTAADERRRGDDQGQHLRRARSRFGSAAPAEPAATAATHGGDDDRHRPRARCRRPAPVTPSRCCCSVPRRCSPPASA